MSQSINLEPVNALDHTAFVGAFASVFEHFPQAAEGAWSARPFASATAFARRDDECYPQDGRQEPARISEPAPVVCPARTFVRER